MNPNKRKYLFSIGIVLATLFAMFLTYELKIHTNYIAEKNVPQLSLMLKAVYFISFISILLYEFFDGNHSIKSIFSVRYLLIFSLITLLTFSISNKTVGIYATGFFVFCALIYFFVKKEVFALNKIYFFLFLYAVFQLIGTVNSEKGFHFPEMTYTFYILPLSFCLFQLEKHTMLRILKIFFRATFIYVFISIVYWFYNFSCFDVSLKSWLTSKISIGEYPIYEFVGKWANYIHPSYISLILFCALISGFYLFYRNEKGAKISLFELVVFILGCLSLELILESRIGIVEVLIITFVSLLYYAKIKSSYFKWSVFAILAAIISLYVVSENHFNKMMGDNVRKADYTLAIHYIHDHPWWGIGYQGQAKAIKMQDEIMKDVTRPITAPPVTYTHNQFLGDMVQFGIPGLIVLLVLLAGLFCYSIKRRNYLLQMFMLIYLIFMFIEEPLYVQEGITRFTIFLCFFIALIEAENPRRSIDLRNWLTKR